MKQECLEIARKWLIEANEELDDGCSQKQMDEIPFSLGSLDKAQMLINHVIELLGIEDEDD